MLSDLIISIYVCIKQKWIPILNWMKNIYHCSKRKKLAIILFTYVSILFFKVAVIGFTHYNNKYDFAVINFDCNSMEVKCGFKNAYSPLSLKVQDMTVELYAQDTQTKSRAVAFKIDEFYFEKSEPMLQNAILNIKSMNNSILFDILTKRKPEVIVRVKAKIRPRFSGIRFMGISINKTHEMKLAKSTPPPCAMYKDFRMEGHDEGYSIATLAINKNYLSFPSWFNIRMKPCVYKFKLPRMSLKVDDFEIRNGVLNKDIKCRIKTDNFQSITSILRQKDENSHIRLEMLKYSGTNELLKRFCNNLTMRFDTGNKSLNAEQDNNAVYYVKLLGFKNRKLSLYTKIADERLKDSLKHFEVLESTKLKFIGYLDNNCPVLSITANFFYKNEIEASVEIEIVNIEKLFEFLYFKKSYLSIALDKNTSLGKVFDSSVLVVDTEGMFTIVNDINNFDYGAEKEKNKIMPKINYAKNVAYEFEHNCTSGENDFSINSVLNFGTYENDTNRIVIDIEEDINICAKADDMTVNFKLERDSRIEVKHKKTLEDGKQEDVPLVDLLTGFMRTELKVSNISLYNRKFITLIEAWYNKRILNANAVNDYKYLALTHCNTIQVEDSPINVEYLMDKADEYSNLDVDVTSERVSILNLTQFRLRDKTIEMHIGNEEDLLVNDDAIVKESNEDKRYTVYTDSHGKTLQIPHVTQQHVIRHTFCMENRMQFNIYSKNFGFMSLDPCKITFVTSKNGMHNIKCSEPIKYTFADEINLCELMCYITKTSVNEVFLCIDKEKDMLSNFIAKVIAARVSVKALDPQNITYEGTMNNFIDLTISDNIVNFGFSVNFCDKIKSNLEDVFGSINVDIPAFKIVFGGENGHFDFSGAKLLYDNSLRKASLSDFKMSASLNMKAVTDYLIFDVKYKSQNVLSETDQLKDILFFARLSKNFKFVNRQKPVTPTETDLQTIINDIKIDSDDDNVIAKVNGEIYIQSLFSLFQKFSQKLRLIYRFEPKWVVNEVNIQNIPLFTIFSDETPFFYLVCRKFTGRQAIFTGEKKCQPLKFNTEIVKNVSLMPLERKISFKSSAFLEFITPEPTTESPPNAIHFHPAIIDKGYFMLRLSKYVKFTDNKVHFVYINEDRRSFVLDMSLVQKTEQYWILAKFFDHRHGSSKLSDRTKRTLGFDFLRPRYFYILIDGKIVYGIDLLNPDVDVIPNKKMGLAIKVAQIFGTLLFNLFARWLEPIETKSLYTESDLTESCKTIDEVFKTCTKATRN